MAKVVAFSLSLLAGAASVAEALHQGGSVSDSPVTKVIQLLGGLHDKIITEGEQVQVTYKEWAEWCEDRAKNLDYEIQTAKSEVEGLKATIAKAGTAVTTLGAKIEETSGSVAGNSADLKAAQAIRKQQEDDFTAAEKELVEVVDSLERAIGILERQLRKGGAAMVQLQHAGGIVQALKVMVDAAMIGSQDAQRLTALVQSAQEGGGDDGDAEDAGLTGAPEAEAYKSQSGSIVETLEGLLDKAREQLESARKTETNEKHNFHMLQQSLEDEMKFGNEDLAAAKKNLAQEQETKATAEGDLAMTAKELALDVKTKSTLKADCQTKAADFESSVRSRAEEVAAIDAAKKALQDMTGGAESLAYGLTQASFVQLGADGHRHSSIKTSADLANFEAVRFVRNLARQQHSQVLTQLARRMAAAMRAGAASGTDPFAKVRGLITDMIKTLEKDAQQDASHKAYCDKEVGETLQKKGEKQYELDKLSTSIDSMSAKSAQLKEEVAQLNKALAELAEAQSSYTKYRQEEHAEYEAAKPEMEQGLEGVKMALKVLREYYAKDGGAHDKQAGGGEGVIGLLEVVESDFTKLLAEMTAAENAADLKYETEKYLNKVERTSKDQDVNYKKKEHAKLDNDAAQSISDREGVQTELAAIMDYKSKLQEICTAKAETHGDRAARREAEVAGLKEALSILEGEAVLLQGQARGKHRRAAAALLQRKALGKK